MRIEREDGWVLPPPKDVVRLEEARTHWISHSGATAVRLDRLELPWDASRKAFKLEIGHYAGEMPRLRLVTDGGEMTYPVEVLPRAEKLSPEAWAAMLADLDAWLSGVTVGMQTATHGEVGTMGVPAPLLAMALVELLPTLRAALQSILDAPRARTRTRVEEVPLPMVRRADGATIRWLSRHPEAVAGMRGDYDVPPLAPQRLASETFDHPANRYLAWLVRRIAEALRECSAELRRLANSDRAKDDPHGQAWLSDRATRIEDEADRLVAMRTRSFLRSLPPQTATEAALTVFQDDPRYARFHRLARLFLSPRFRLRSSDHPKAAMRPSFELYELWTFLAMERLLRDALPTATWSRQGFEKLLDPGSTGTGAGCAAKLDEGTLRIRFNLRFYGFLNRGERRRFSLSKARRPDLVITWEPTCGTPSWVCLDAKYRVGPDALADAFASLHLYRDSLRYVPFGGPCRAAWLLVPARDPACEPWFSEAFFESHGLGVVRLRPGERLPSEFVRTVLRTLGIEGAELREEKVAGRR